MHLYVHGLWCVLHIGAPVIALPTGLAAAAHAAHGAYLRVEGTMLSCNCFAPAWHLLPQHDRAVV